MIASCDPAKVHALLDGELPAAPAAAVRLHLGRCTSCQSAFEDALLVDVLAESFGVPEPPAPAPALPPPQPAVKRRVALVAGLALVVAALIGWWPPRRQPAQTAVAPSFEMLATQPRHHEWRVAHPAADRHRRLARGQPPGALDLSAIERAGDAHALAVAELLTGQTAAAEARLRVLAPTPDVLSDRAAVALARGQLEVARALLDAALSRAPRHPQALWNQALVRERQGHHAAAARLYRAVAALGEPGWSDEARGRAARAGSAR